MAATQQGPDRLIPTGFDNVTGKWNEYSSYVNAEGLEIRSSGMYNENPSVVFDGNGYNPQMPYGPYPETTQLASARGDGKLHAAQQFSISDPLSYQQPIAPNIPYVTSSTPVSQTELPSEIGKQGDCKPFGLNLGYPPSLGSFGSRSNFSENSDGLGFMSDGSDVFGFGSLWSDCSIPLKERSKLSSPAASQQPVGSLSMSRTDFGMASQQHGSLSRFGSQSSLNYRGYSSSGINQSSSFRNTSISTTSAMNGWNWLPYDKAKSGGNSDTSFGCTGTIDTLIEQNRGPRASKPKNRTTANESFVNNSKNGTCTGVQRESYNRLDFVTEYKDAKFFVIKSYSEDNVHKSIKYGVWVSTPNGNKRLDSAFHEAKEKHGNCPIFLLFSVNASAQFCGVAEMVGPVDYDKSVDYWKQDKWTGQFPVKWHIIKDVPNSQFRHIILENNDNKPVTNSRDTQEVELEQGNEMLNIFRNYESDSSILDDFDFYEDRQKAMQEKKTQHKASLLAAPMVVGSQQQIRRSLPTHLIHKMSKTFAQAVLLNENDKERSPAGKAVPGAARLRGSRVEPEKTRATMA